MAATNFLSPLIILIFALYLRPKPSVETGNYESYTGKYILPATITTSTSLDVGKEASLSLGRRKRTAILFSNSKTSVLLRVLMSCGDIELNPVEVSMWGMHQTSQEQPERRSM